MDPTLKHLHADRAPAEILPNFLEELYQPRSRRPYQRR